MIARRVALSRMMAITGGLVLGAEYFLSGCARTDKSVSITFTPEDLALLDEIGETIIPATDVPGAKAVGIGAFMAMMVKDCYDDTAHEAFYEGLGTLEKRSRKAHGQSFMKLTAAERLSLLNTLDAEQKTYTQQRERNQPPHYFKLMKDLTLLGYFTSDIGCTQALRYAETPGSYDGNAPYQPGDHSWVNPMRRS